MADPRQYIILPLSHGQQFSLPASQPSTSCPSPLDLTDQSSPVPLVRQSGKRHQQPSVVAGRQLTSIVAYRQGVSGGSAAQQ